MKSKIKELNLNHTEHAIASINSYLGVLGHSASYNIRHDIINTNNISQKFHIDADCLKVT